MYKGCVYTFTLFFKTFLLRHLSRSIHQKSISKSEDSIDAVTFFHLRLGNVTADLTHEDRIILSNGIEIAQYINS